MIIFVALINVLLVVYSIFHIIRYAIFKKRTKNIEIRYENFNDFNLVIVIPCLNEQSTIVDTVKYLKSITKDYNNISIILVTTAKEKSEISTKEIIEKQLLTSNSNVYLCHYSNDNGIMADQLNYAIDNIEKYLPQNYSDKKTYYCVYNADSRPSRNTIDEFINIVKKNNYPQIMQQYSYALSNYNALNFILKGFAIYQSNFELKIGLLNTFFKNTMLHKHLVGHGLFIRLDLLKKIKGFNNKYWCEDNYMTAVINNYSIDIYPFLTLENMETPDKLTKLIKQNGVWFSTAYKNIKIYKEVFKKQNDISKMGFFGLINEIRSVINWLFFPIIILVTLAISLFNGVIIFIISVLAYAFYIFCYSYTTIKIINHLEHNNITYTPITFFSTFLATIISNLGPLYYLLVRPKEKYKTER